MKIKNQKFQWMIVLMLVLIFYLHVGIALAEEIPITTDPNMQVLPSIDGDLIVYTDFRDSSTAAEIYLYDLSTQTETRITDDPAHQGGPIISGDLIVYTDRRHGNSEIYLFDLSTMGETRITNDPATQERPDIHGRWIAWLDWRTSPECPPEGGVVLIDPTVFVYDIETSTETTIMGPIDTSYGGWLDGGGPSIDGDQVVWRFDQDWMVKDCFGMPMVGGGDWPNIIISDLSDFPTINHTMVGDGFTLAYYPKISGDYVIYEAWADNDVYIYDISTGQEAMIINHPAEKLAFDGNRVVFIRNGFLYLYDIIIGEEWQIVDEPVADFAPAISGNKIVYTADRFGNYDIFLYELPGFHPLKDRSNEPLKLHCGATGEPWAFIGWAAAPLIIPLLIIMALKRRARSGR